jgi:hypothetical protein
MAMIGTTLGHIPENLQAPNIASPKMNLLSLPGGRFLHDTITGK